MSAQNARTVLQMLPSFAIDTGMLCTAERSGLQECIMCEITISFPQSCRGHVSRPAIGGVLPAQDMLGPEFEVAEFKNVLSPLYNKVIDLKLLDTLAGLKHPLLSARIQIFIVYATRGLLIALCSRFQTYCQAY